MAKISRVEVQKRNKSRYSIFIDDEYAFSVSDDILVKHSLLKGRELESSFIEEVLLEEELAKAKSVALRYLGHRVRSSKEVREKLDEKGYGEFSDKVMDYLEKNGYIDDVEFAILFAKDKMKLGRFGKNRVKLELVKKGIDNDTISIAIDEVFDYEDELESAIELAKKKAESSYRNDDLQSKKRKLYAFLYRKGYAADLIEKVFKEVL